MIAMLRSGRMLTLAGKKGRELYHMRGLEAREVLVKTEA